MGEKRVPLLEEYREARQLPEEARGRLWQRIESSVQTGDIGPRLSPEPQTSHRRAWLTTALVCAAAVAAFLLIDSQVLQRSADPPAHEAAQVSEAAKAKRTRQAERMQRVRTPPIVDTQEPEPTPEPEAPTVRRPRPPPPPGTALAAELAVLKGAERALEQGEPSKALALLDRHETQHGAGQLREDRMALRIQALCALEKGAQARGEARLFAREFPDSPHLKKVRNACPEAKP